MKAIRALTIAMSIFLLGCIACARTDLASPENFKHFKGIVTHVYKNTFVVESDDGQKMTFRAGRNTVFIPRPARRMGWGMGSGHANYLKLLKNKRKNTLI